MHGLSGACENGMRVLHDLQPSAYLPVHAALVYMGDDESLLRCSVSARAGFSRER